MNLRSFVVRLGGAAVLAAMATLAGCNANVRSGGETTVNVPQQYDMTIGAYKDNQFMLGGAVLSSPDLEAHFRYLQDQKQLPQTVLLTDTDDANVNNADLEEFASLQLSFKFTGYVMHKGKLTLMSAVESAKDKDKKKAVSRFSSRGGREGLCHGRHVQHRAAYFSAPPVILASQDVVSAVRTMIRNAVTICSRGIPGCPCAAACFGSHGTCTNPAWVFRFLRRACISA